LSCKKQKINGKIKEIGIVFHIENIERKTNFIYCGKESRKVHQNNELTIRDLSFREQEVYLKINRRQVKYNKCGKKFAEELNYVPKKRTYTERFRKKHSHYQTKENGERKMLLCQECKSYFAETHGTVIAGLGTPLSEITRVLKTKMEGMGLNAAVRTFGYSKKTILNWEKKLSRLQETLFLYALVNEFVKLVIEGDELYTKIRKNEKASASLGLDNRTDTKGKSLYLAFKMWSKRAEVISRSNDNSSGII